MSPARRLAFLIATLVPAALFAQEPVPITRITTAITLDGRSDEAAWQGVAPFSLTTYLPVAGKRPIDSSEVRLAYDDEYLYASARFYVANAGEIQSSSLSRDELNNADDRFRLMFDTFNDGRTGVGFLVTPTGARSDYDMTDDGHFSNSWNTYWDAAVSRDAKGWYAEMRIPWSSLRFRPENGRVTMGVIALRVSAKKNEWATYPSLPSTMANALWRASLAQKISFEGVKPHAPLYLTPYLLGGSSRKAVLPTGATSFDHEVSNSAHFGGDLKYRVGDALTLDLTANTDFAQVEADNQQVNLSRFSLFFPEKRQFFLERAGSFNFNTGSGNQLFYSRRIGLADDGTPRTLYGGARLVGNVGALELGAMNLQADAGNGESENIGVVRARRTAFNPGSYIGGIVTSRLSNGHHNAVYGLDALVRPFGNEFVTVQGAQSTDDVTGSGRDASQVRVNWERRASQGLIYSVSSKWSGRDFNPGLGFEERQDYSMQDLELDYNWISKQGYSLAPSFYGRVYHRNRDGAVDSRLLYPYINFGLPSGFNGWVAWIGSRENLVDPLPLSGSVTVPAGTHDFGVWELHLVGPTGSKLSYVLNATTGGFYDGRQTFVHWAPNLNLSAHFSVGGDVQVNRIRFPSRDERLNADLYRLKLQAAWNTRLSAATFVQYNHAGKLAVGNVRVRYQFAEGSDLYLVYNDRLNVDRMRLMPAQPELPVSQERTLLVKYTRTFIR
ncbi:MAG: DUF5916 domain-containing protein [Gemmatimonadales bacterium]